MNDPELVSLLKSASEFNDDRDDLADCLEPALGHHFGQRDSFDKSHREIVYIPDFSDVVNGAQIGVPQLSRGACLAVEAVDRLGTLAQERRLDGHVTMQLGIVRQIDGTHRTPTEHADDLIS